MESMVYWLLTAKLGDSLPVKIAACVLGLAVCYAFGTAWFLVLYARTTGPIGVTTALSWCVLPYIGSGHYLFEELADGSDVHFFFSRLAVNVQLVDILHIVVEHCIIPYK